MRLLSIFFIFFSVASVFGQYTITGRVMQQETETKKLTPVAFAKVKLPKANVYAESNEQGNFVLKNVPEGKHKYEVFAYGFDLYRDTLDASNPELSIILSSIQKIEEMVVTGTLKEVSKKESTVNIEVYTPKFFKKNPTPSVFEALQNVNGVRPQLNCNICNTGDIHINGLEGPYTMVLIDGMPIVSSLSTVYGLSGIPNSLVERIEIVKGPASTLYGSEAIGGVINVITKNPIGAPVLSADVYTTSWLETNADIGFKTRLQGKNNDKGADVLTGINYFNYNLPVDNNHDGFTDVTLQNRISAFQKWNFKRKDYRQFSIAGRYLYEDRWGGEMDWTAQQRGGDSIYGESIYTKRWELLGNYQLPMKEKVFLSSSITNHDQNSFYGTTSFQAQQFIAFGQLYWDKKIKRHDLLVGTAVRYTKYDDDTKATEIEENNIISNSPSNTIIPGVYVQDEIHLNEKTKLLTGIRYDYHPNHGSIITPRLGFKTATDKEHIFRLNLGTGYRVVNIFTEDHAALTGARDVIIEGDIAPEQSYNANLNYNKTFITPKNRYYSVDLSGFYTYFENRIIADYDSNPNEIRYANLNSHAVSQGVSLSLTMKPIRALTMMLGATYMDIGTFESGQKEQQILTEKFTGTWTVSYEISKIYLEIDYTGSIYSPMRLPLLNEHDPRAEYSPWWSLQNIQVTFNKFKRWEIYGGVKNLLNWTPNKNTAFLIARSEDPFDKNVQFDANGVAQVTADNPYGLTFDPAYVYAPNQGIRGFLGIRYVIR